jgi:hypothetical protein
MSKMKVLGYANGNDYYPSLLTIFLKDDDGTYAMWPLPSINEIDEVVDVEGFIEEKNEMYIDIDKDAPSHVAFSMNENEITILEVKNMYKHISFVLKRDSISTEDRAHLKRMLSEFS